MAIDNTIYSRLADSWWDERGFLFTLKALNPVRFGYMRRILLEQLRLEPAGRRVLDIGCGGGLLAEEFARLGFAVTGVDPSEESLDVARRHADTAGLAIEYRHGTGEALPFPEAGFDVAYCCDVLEHVADVGRVIGETARVLKPGGVFLYDTFNRTFASWVAMIFLLQGLPWTRLMPPRLHDWRRFVRPGELHRLLERHGLVPRGLSGLKPRSGTLPVLRALRARERGELSYADVIARMDIGETRDTSVQYIGYAVKA
jgi:2-polyprenyl-6-hydroxyphenyl methylase / 3-demethylubiquinone-9 3-methyltransferase